MSELEDKRMFINRVMNYCKTAAPGPWTVKYGRHGKIQNTQIISNNHALTRFAGDIHGPVHNIATVWNVTCTCIQGKQYDNQTFIAEARTDLPDAIKSLKEEIERSERLTKENAELRHDISRYVQITSDQANEIAQLRQSLAVAK